MADVPIRLVLGFADDAERAELARLLADHACVVRAAGRTADDVVRLALRHRPHAVLLGVDLPGGGILAVRELARRLPSAAVVTMGPALRVDELVRALRLFVSTSLAAEKLSAREREIMELLAGGLSTGQVARRLFLSPTTIRVHVSASLRKLRVSDREAAFALLRPTSP